MFAQTISTVSDGRQTQYRLSVARTGFRVEILHEANEETDNPTVIVERGQIRRKAVML